MKANVERKGERKQSFGEKQSRLAKVGGVKLKAISNSVDRDGAPPEIKRLVLNAEIPIALRLNSLYESRRKKNWPAKGS